MMKQIKTNFLLAEGPTLIQVKTSQKQRKHKKEAKRNIYKLC